MRLRLISDVPLGAFLSGGVDSSAVVALMAGLSNGPVKTFSIGFDEKDYDELPYARLVAQRYGTDHHEFVVRPDAVAIFPQLVWHYNEPYADASAIPTYYLSELARRHVTVALNGDAGDENFAGYRRYITPPPGAALRSACRRRCARRSAGLRAPSPAPGRSDSVMYRGPPVAAAAVGHARRAATARRMMIFEPDLKADVCEPAFLEAAGGETHAAPTS